MAHELRCLLIDKAQLVAHGSLSEPDISNIPPGRLWGPSSQHAGGIVNHVFADAHVEGISDQIDANVYLWIVTRNGGEALPAMN